MTSPQALNPAPAALDLVWEIAGEDCVELGGAERKNFLNSYVTQDIKNLGVDRFAPAAFLTQKGKLVSEARVWNLPDVITVIFPPGYGARVEAHLATFLLFANVVWKSRSADFVHFAGLGPRARAAAQQWLGVRDSEPGQIHHVAIESAEAFFTATNVLGGEGWELLAPVAAAPRIRAQCAAWEAAGTTSPADPQALETLRIEAGVPRMGVDMGEDNLVAEVGLDVAATSFNKGCYLGQETTARVQSRGHVNRKLARVRLGQAFFQKLPVELFQGDRKVGQLTSAAESPRFGGWIGLATVALNAWENPGEIFAETETGRVSIEKL